MGINLNAFTIVNAQILCIDTLVLTQSNAFLIRLKMTRQLLQVEAFLMIIMHYADILGA